MKPLMRRIFVVLISVITLGLYIPPTHMDTEASDKKELSDKKDVNEPSIEVEEDSFSEDGWDLDSSEETITDAEVIIYEMTEQAKESTLSKMGPRIIQKVDEDITAEILPKIEEVMGDILSAAGEEEIPYYEITEEPTPGYGEKIFNIYNHRTNEEIARFHVRRDKRPRDGYWFNFHYHLNEDQFATHHQIGEVYWEKNTPPKWMS